MIYFSNTYSKNLFFWCYYCICMAVNPRILAIEAETFLRYTLGYVDYEHLIQWNSKKSMCNNYVGFSQIQSYTVKHSQPILMALFYVCCKQIAYSCWTICLWCVKNLPNMTKLWCGFSLMSLMNWKIHHFLIANYMQ